jgi:hypothetical protein
MKKISDLETTENGRQRLIEYAEGGGSVVYKGQKYHLVPEGDSYAWANSKGIIPANGIQNDIYSKIGVNSHDAENLLAEGVRRLNELDVSRKLGTKPRLRQKRLFQVLKSHYDNRNTLYVLAGVVDASEVLKEIKNHDPVLHEQYDTGKLKSDIKALRKKVSILFKN